MLPVIVGIEYVYALFEQVLSGPEITGAGVGKMSTFFLTMESQPRSLVCFKVKVPDPVAPHRTVKLFVLTGPKMVPPEMDQEYVCPKTGDTV